jgi:DNA polymerase-1
MSVLLVDGNNMAYRAKYAFNLSNKGMDVSISYGMLRMLKKLMEKFEPSSVIVCWDGGVPEFRRQAVPSYKANRHLDDDPLERDNFITQVQELDLYAFPLMGIVSARRIGAEADDLLYHASRIMADSDVIIVTSDKDLLQSINGWVSVYAPNKDKLYTADNIEDELDIPLSQYIDWRAVQGDSSDNIPGVKGVGEKTATKLFKTYGSLTGIVNMALGINPNTDKKMTERMKENINDFGFERLSANVKVMALYADRVGARMEIINAVNKWKPANKTRIKRYLMNNAFASLMDGKFYHLLLDLDKPSMILDGVRCPAIYPKRVPV